MILDNKKTAEDDKTAQRRADELEELSKLTGHLAHEIKNPLSTIKVNLKLISEDIDGKDRRAERALRKIAVVQKETGRIEQILNDFLRYIGKTELRIVEADINELIGDMIDFYTPQAQSHLIVIRPGLRRGPLICRVDVDMLKQVVLNLFINAQQAMTDGGELIIRTAKEQNLAVITISDTGRGIEPQDSDRIFDAYYSTKPAGSGLGLSIAKKVIDAHNGTIRVDSEPGKGTAFTIKLPLKK
ncbi:MAG: sensor histidine kinase [Planctomycetes bacterium]|nr:sensor histidine kinase [Planctomycetota bacterium]